MYTAHGLTAKLNVAESASLSAERCVSCDPRMEGHIFLSYLHTWLLVLRRLESDQDLIE